MSKEEEEEEDEFDDFDAPDDPSALSTQQVIVWSTDQWRIAHERLHVLEDAWVQCKAHSFPGTLCMFCVRFLHAPA